MLHVPLCQLANSYRGFGEAQCLYLQGSSEISVNFYPSVERDVPEDLCLQQDRCECLRALILQTSLLERAKHSVILSADDPSF
jgi:hypothetical protein